MQRQATAWEELVSRLVRVPAHGQRTQRVTCAPVEGKGAGLVAPVGAEQGDSLLELPFEHALFEPELTTPAAGASASSGCSCTAWHCALAEQLLGATDTAYTQLVLDGLPESLIALAEGTALAPAYQPLHSAVTQVSSQLEEARRKDAVETHGEPAFISASLSILSRSLVVFGKRALLPGVDMINHGGDRHANVRISASRAARKVCVTAARDLRPGEELLISYGGDSRGGDDFAAYYGFLPEDAKAYDMSLLGDAGTFQLNTDERRRAHECTSFAISNASSGSNAQSKVPLLPFGHSTMEHVFMCRVPLQMHMNNPGALEIMQQPFIARASGSLVDARLVAAYNWDWNAVGEAVHSACAQQLQQLGKYKEQQCESVLPGGLASEYISLKEYGYNTLMQLVG